MQNAVLHTLAYPFLTAQRRMEAQSSGKPGMLHPRYDNYLSCVFHSFKEEGFKGLYRGYTPYIIAVTIGFTFVPYLAEELMKLTTLYG